LPNRQIPVIMLYYKCKQEVVNHRKEVSTMTKAQFLTKWRNDYVFRADMKAKGIRVIQDNVIFFNEDGTINHIASQYII